MREAGFHQQISLKRLKGAEYYKVNERKRGNLHFLKVFFLLKKNHHFFFFFRIQLRMGIQTCNR